MSSETTRVLHVVTQREPAGAQRVAHQLCESFRSRGIESDVWFLYRRRPAFEAFAYRDIVENRPGPLGTIGMIWSLVTMMRQWQPTVVIAHTHHANVFATIAARVAGVPRRIIVHHTLGPGEGALRRALLGVLRRARLFTQEVFVSASTRHSYGPRATRRGVIIHNGIEISPLDLDDLGSVPKGARFWAADPRPSRDRPLLVSIGRLADQKGHRTAIDAMVGIDAHLAIVGEGDLRADLQARIDANGVSDRVTLVGNIDPDEVPSALRAADLVVLPSVWEAFGMLVLEAMSNGCTLVVSDIAAHREALDTTARYHDVGDAEGLRNQITDLLDSPTERRRLGNGARTRVGLFSLTHTVDAYLQLCQPCRPQRDQDAPTR